MHEYHPAYVTGTYDIGPLVDSAASFFDSRAREFRDSWNALRHWMKSLDTRTRSYGSIAAGLVGLLVLIGRGYGSYHVDQIPSFEEGTVVVLATAHNPNSGSVVLESLLEDSGCSAQDGGALSLPPLIPSAGLLSFSCPEGEVTQIGFRVVNRTGNVSEEVHLTVEPRTVGEQIYDLVPWIAPQVAQASE